MRTQRTIGAIVGIVVLAAVGLAVDLVLELGVALGLGVFVLGVAATLTGYRFVVGPRLRRWGATDAEVGRTMPGDGLLPDAASTTRAITVRAPTDAVWPWLVQLGWGRGGWYSYDWIDNDGRPSAQRIDPSLQDLAVGDRILMTPTMGPTVREMVVDHHLVAEDATVGSWCLALYPTDDGCRLVSRWRIDPPAPSLAGWVWTALSDPGSWVMEQRMLRGIRDRAERTTARRRHPAGTAR